MDISDTNESQQPEEAQQHQHILQQNQENNFGNPNNLDSGNIDIDANLLQQFSCLGTRDHEELINDLQKTLDYQLNKEAARFFLDMSNWNLQDAICCYLDFRYFPSMKIVDHTRPSDHTQIWKLLNDGEERWPKGCHLIATNQAQRIEVPSLQPGQTVNVVASIPPTVQASMWRLCTSKGYYFGDSIWMIPSGEDDTATDLAQRMSQLRTSTGEESMPQVNIVILVKTD